MDFSKLKEFTISEGKVKSLSINGVKVWEKYDGITDLTNTTWKFNDKISLVDFNNNLLPIYPNKKVPLNFTISNGKACTEVFVVDNYTMYFTGAGGVYYQGWKYFDVGQYAQTIHITGGKGATDKVFIEWLQANAVQIYSAQVTVTNTSTSYDAEIYWNGATGVVVSKNSTVTFTVPQGTNITIQATSGLMPAWDTTSVVGDCVDNSTTGGDFIINGDCTIVGYAWDAD